MSKGAWVRIMGADGQVKQFTIEPLPARGLANCRMVEFDGAILAVSQSGRLHGTGPLPTKSYSYAGWTWPWLKRLAYCLRFLGVITREDEQATIKLHEAEVTRVQQDADRDTLLRYAAKFGIEASVTNLLPGAPAPEGN